MYVYIWCGTYRIPPPYHVTDKMPISMLFHFCWQLVALLWLQPDLALAQSTGKNTTSQGSSPLQLENNFMQWLRDAVSLCVRSYVASLLSCVVGIDKDKLRDSEEL